MSDLEKVEELTIREKLALSILVLKAVKEDYEGLVEVAENNRFWKLSTDAKETIQFIEKMINIVKE